jgi:hypothetical protein
VRRPDLEIVTDGFPLDEVVAAVDRALLVES